MSTTPLGPDEKLFLKLAVKGGLLSRPQAQNLMQRAAASRRSPAELALTEAWLGREQVDRIERAVNASRVARLDRLYARIARDRGFTPERQLLRALEIQRDGGYETRLGEILLRANLIDLSQHAEVLRAVLERIGDRGLLAPPEPEHYDSDSDSDSDSDPDSGLAPSAPRSSPNSTQPPPNKTAGEPASSGPSAAPTNFAEATRSDDGTTRASRRFRRRPPTNSGRSRPPSHSNQIGRPSGATNAQPVLELRAEKPSAANNPMMEATRSDPGLTGNGLVDPALEPAWDRQTRISEDFNRIDDDRPVGIDTDEPPLVAFGSSLDIDHDDDQNHDPNHDPNHHPNHHPNYDSPNLLTGTRRSGPPGAELVDIDDGLSQGSSRSASTNDDDPLARLLAAERARARNQTTDTQRNFVASAVAMASEESDSELHARDRALLEDEVKAAERLSRSGLTNIQVLDQLKLTGGSAPSFEPNEYFRKRQLEKGRRQGLLSVAAALILLILLVFARGYQNSWRLAALRKRAANADFNRDPRVAYNELVTLNAELKQIGTWGLDDNELVQAQIELAEALLEAKVRERLSEGRPEEARAAIAGARDEREAWLKAGLTPGILGHRTETLRPLEQLISLEELWQALLTIDRPERGSILDDSAALLLVRRAMQLGPKDPQRWQTRAESLRQRLRQHLANLANTAQSGQPDAIMAYERAAKRVAEIFGESPKLMESQLERARGLALKGRRLGADQKYQDALAVMREAYALSPNLDFAAEVHTFERLVRGQRLYIGAQQLIAERRFELARSRLLQARELVTFDINLCRSIDEAIDSVARAAEVPP